MRRFDVYKKTPNENKNEMHLPGYNFCGPGTQVEARIKRGKYIYIIFNKY
jgi:hypothetical protein